MNRLTDVLDASRPAMAAVFTEPVGDEALGAINLAADVAEIRIDRFLQLVPDTMTSNVRRLATLPLILTIRMAEEGGAWGGPEEDRLDLFKELIPLVDGVDIELASDIFDDVQDAAQEHNKAVIASSHHFTATPAEEALQELLQEGRYQREANYVKIAASAKTKEEYQRLAAFTLNNKDSGVIVVAMDEYGPLSRIAFPSLGSCLTYASANGAPAAPGQLGYQETYSLLSGLYPVHPG